MSYTFGAQPAGNSLFGQTPNFGTQPPFGVATTLPAATPQFGATFGGGVQQPTGLQFGNPTTTPSLFGQTQPGAFSLSSTPATSANTFGAPGLFGTVSSAPSTGVMFGAPTSAAPAFGTGLTFGAPTSTAPAPAFGAPASTVPSYGFGSSFGTPASTQSLTFGTSTALPPTGLTFATPATTGLTFGTPTIPSTGIGFGSGTAGLSAPTTGLTFGTPTTTAPTFGAPTGLGFGSTPVSSSLTFGATTTAQAQNSPFTLGATTTTPNLPMGTGTTLNFGSTPVTTGIKFGTPATTALSFIPQNVTTTATPPTSLFNTASTNTGLTFATPTTTPALNFTAKTTGGLTFGPTSLALGGTTAGNTSTSLTFNSPFASTTSATTTATPFAGLGLGTTLTATTPSLGLGGIPTAKTVTTTPTQVGLGLGGISTTAPKPTVASTITSQSELPPRDQPLPNELLQTVDSFKAFLKEQKAHSSEIARFSMKELKTVEVNIVNVNNTINELENDLQKNKCVAEKLKLDSADALKYAEMAQRTFEIPAGMQYDNSAPIQFFVHLLHDFERDLQQLRFNLDCVNKQIKNGNSVSNLTSEDLALGLRRLHQTFVTLAGRLQTVHNQVEIQKERYLTLRKSILNDNTNIFECQSKDLEALEYALKSIANENKVPEVIAGPSPFNSLGTGQAQLLAQNPPPAYPGTSLGQMPREAWASSGFNAKPLFGATMGNTSSLFSSPTSNSFQLQKPPTGSKRGKT